MSKNKPYTAANSLFGLVRRHNKRIGVFKTSRGIGVKLQRVMDEDDPNKDNVQAIREMCIKVRRGKVLETTLLISEEGFIDLMHAYRMMKQEQWVEERKTIFKSSRDE